MCVCVCVCVCGCVCSNRLDGTGMRHASRKDLRSEFISYGYEREQSLQYVTVVCSINNTLSPQPCVSNRGTRGLIEFSK